MLVLIAALAAPIHRLPPVSCGEDPFPFTLLQRVEALHFHPDGTLWVADRGSLTRRDPTTLAVLEKPLPGTDGWGPDAERGWVRGPARYRLSDGALARVRPDDPPPSAPPGPPFPLPPEPIPATVASSRLQAQALTDRDPRAPHPTAVAHDPRRGRHAVATPGWLRVFDGSGVTVTEIPVAGGTDAFGMLRGRPFTVSYGRAILWGADGSYHILPGTWVGASVFDEALYLTDTDGWLIRYEPDTDRLHRIGCAVERCAPSTLPPLPAPRADEPPASYGPVVTAWASSVERTLREARPRPTELHSAGRFLVVAELEVEPWRAFGFHAIRALRVLDRRARLRAERRFPTSVAEPLVVLEDSVFLGDRAFSLPRLQPASRPRPDGPSARLGPHRVELGLLSNGHLLPGALPPRPFPQRRTWPRAIPVDGGFLVASLGRPGPDEPVPVMGAVELICSPRGPTPWDGTGLTGKDAPDLSWDEARSQLPPAPPRRFLSNRIGTRDRGPGSDDHRDVLRWAEPGMTAVPPKLSERHERLVLLTDTPAPADLPHDTLWIRRAYPPAPFASIARRGIVVWQGRPWTLPSHIPTSPDRPAVPDSLRERWARRASRDGSTLEEAREDLLLALKTGDGTNIRRAAERLTELAPRGLGPLVLVRGTPFPEALPDPLTLVALEPQSTAVAWTLADRSGLPVVVLSDRALSPHRGVELRPRRGRFADLPPRSLLLVENGTIVWSGTTLDDLERHRNAIDE